jgi:hypothetical protein
MSCSSHLLFELFDCLIAPSPPFRTVILRPKIESMLKPDVMSDILTGNPFKALDLIKLCHKFLVWQFGRRRIGQRRHRSIFYWRDSPEEQVGFQSLLRVIFPLS